MGSLTQILQISSLIVEYCTRVWDGPEREGVSLSVPIFSSLRRKARKKTCTRKADQSPTSRRLLLPKAGKKPASHLLTQPLSPILLYSEQTEPNRPWLGSPAYPWAPPGVTFCQQLILGFSIFLQDELKITWCIMHSHAQCNPQMRKKEEKLGIEKTSIKWHKKALQRQKQLGICACWRSGRRWNIKAPTHSCSFI